jgi:hypothetical protein
VAPVTLSITLVEPYASGYAPAIGMADAIISGTSSLTLSGISADVHLVPNDEITPIGTLYQFHVSSSGVTKTAHYEVTAGEDDLQLSEVFGGVLVSA